MDPAPWHTDMNLADQFVIQTWCLYTHVRIDMWTLVHTHQEHENPPTESLSPVSVRTIAFSHPLQHMMGVVVLETEMSVLYALTLCDPKTFCFNSWPFCTLYDHVFSFPRTALPISHSDMCGKEFKKTWQFVRICRFVFCHFTTQKQHTDIHI